MKTIFPFRRVLPVLLLAGLSAAGVATAQENVPVYHKSNPPPPPPPHKFHLNNSASADNIILSEVTAAPEAQSSSSSSPEAEPTLPTVTVTGQSERDPTTENTGSYTTGATTTTTKLPLTLRETPQSITIITRQQMDDFGLNSVNEVLQNTSSVYVEKRATVSAYQSRGGFFLQTQYDGIANPTFDSGLISGYIVSPDSAFLDHIEIQQGAAGLLTGAGEPGGTINLVRKRPTETFQAHVEAELGSWDKKRLVGDVSGPLTPSGVLRGRFVVVADDSDSFIDYVYDNKKAFYGILELVPSADTKIGIGLQYQQDKYRLFSGVPSDNGRDVGLSRSSFFGDPYDESKRETFSTFLSFEQKLPNDWVLKGNYAHNEQKNDDIGSQIWGTLDVTTGDGLYAWRTRMVTKVKTDSLDAHASGPLQLLGRRHEFALGANGVKRKSCFNRDWNGQDDAFNVYTFPSGFPVYEKPSFDCDEEGEDKTRQYGLWGVARLNIADPLKLILGARVSWYDFTEKSGVQTMDENAVFSPYAGIVYDLNERLSVYASYSDIFTPQTYKDRSGSVLEPVVGANYEIGIKGEFFAKRLNAAAAIFRLEQTNLPEMDENSGISALCDDWYCYYASGKVVTEGMDLSLNGALTPNWNIGVGYTFANSEYATGEDKGERYQFRVPKQIFRVASTYRIPGSNWTVGGNLRAQSRTAGNRNGAHLLVKQSGFALLGLMAKYQINKQAEISLVANNVFDRRYRYPNNVGANHYGEPRNVFASVKYRF
jgi:outer membrane receptor for ferric coprogen and ferric-rhodotorulic acid